MVISMLCTDSIPNTLCAKKLKIGDELGFATISLRRSPATPTKSAGNAVKKKKDVSAENIRTIALLHEAADELRDVVRRGIERGMTRIEDVHFGIRDIAAIVPPQSMRATLLDVGITRCSIFLGLRYLIAGSQCSSAFPLTNRHISNHAVV